MLNNDNDNVPLRQDRKHALPRGTAYVWMRFKIITMTHNNLSKCFKLLQTIEFRHDENNTFDDGRITFSNIPLVIAMCPHVPSPRTLPRGTDYL